jgi:peptide/nickel transport system substrate-binding protein
MQQRLTLVALAVSGLLLSGCAATAPIVSGSADSDATVDIQVGIEPTSLDITSTAGAALQQLLIGNVYEGLVARNMSGELVPSLATEWTVSEDRLTYTFELREASFHDGAPLTVDDVVASIEAASAPDSLNSDAKKMIGIESISAIDDDTVEITLSARNINFLDTLSSTGGLVVRADESADLANTTNGTGPYTVAQWNKGATITLDRVDDYWGETPSNQSVVFHYIADPTAASNALATGEVDILTDATAEAVAYFEGNDEFLVDAGDSTSWMTFGMNSASGPLADAEVRQALRMGIDKQGLIDVIGGNAAQVGSMVVPSDPWYTDLTDVHSYDPDAARELLADAGYEQLALTLTVANTYDAKISEYVAAQLSEIGVALTIDSVEFSTWLERVYQNKEYELTLVMHVDPWTLTYYGNPGYYWNYDNPAAQQLAAAAREADDFEERNEKLTELATIVADDAASDWLYSPQTMVISSTSVSGFPINRIANHFLVSGITVTE